MDESLVARYPNLERRHFWWATRRRLVVQLLKTFNLGERFTVLDVGCGSGVMADALASCGADVVGVDLEVAALHDTSSARLLSGDYFALSPELGEFDLVMALDFLEHIEDDKAALESIVDNTTPGGTVLLMVPAYMWLWSTYDTQNEHFRRYTRTDVVRGMQRAGLKIERAGYLFASLLIPKLALSLYERVASREGPSGTGVDGRMNRFAAAYFWAETSLASKRQHFFPAGTSVIAIARKPN